MPRSIDVPALIEGVKSGDRAALARSITLVESRKPAHRALARELLRELAPLSGNSIRLGLSGVPGAGKSTFTDALGVTLIEKGHRVAVLAVDPSSSVSGGSVLGVDVSRPMIDFARARLTDAREGQDSDAQKVEFAALDVENDELPLPFDAAFSRLGVMFFDDPTAAFANIARSLRPHGRLAFVCFASPLENPFIAVPTFAALAVLGGPPMPPPGAPGPFSLADPDLLRGVLESAGFESVALSRGPDEVTLGPAGALDEVARQALEQNPAVMSLLDADHDARDAAVTAAADALSAHVVDGDIRLGAGTWIVEARAPGA